MKLLFWNVDTQKDFMNKDGALYIEGAESIKPNLEKMTNLAIDFDIEVVNTTDWHFITDTELSIKPDFMNTFPKHCMVNTEGAELIKETNYIKPGDIVIRKNKFDVFAGSMNTDLKGIEKMLENINPEVIVVYGVATNVCVNFAILGLVKRGYKVIVVEDAIKELPNLDVNIIYQNWKDIGVVFETTDNIEKIIKLDEIKTQVLNLCYAIEELPASEQQTRISVMASEIFNELKSRPKSCLDVKEILKNNFYHEWDRSGSIHPDMLKAIEKANSEIKQTIIKFSRPKVDVKKLEKFLLANPLGYKKLATAISEEIEKGLLTKEK